jgi:hypothetical protein
MVAWTSHSLHRRVSRLTWAKARPYQKNKSKQDGGVVQEVECLPTKCKTLNSNSNTEKHNMESIVNPIVLSLDLIETNF